MSDLLFNIGITLVTIIGMEIFAYLTHRYIMHGPLGWGWHKSHHEPHDEAFERNDLYAAVFAVPSFACILLGSLYSTPLMFFGFGLTGYGIIYFVLHDMLVHKRWNMKVKPRGTYLKRLYQAHRMHHAVQGRKDCVSFGFLYAPPVETLKRQLKDRHGDRPFQAGDDIRPA